MQLWTGAKFYLKRIDRVNARKSWLWIWISQSMENLWKTSWKKTQIFEYLNIFSDGAAHENLDQKSIKVN